PTPEEVPVFALDRAADKRTKIVTKLLGDPRFGENWGRYWRDVIMYRKTEERLQFLVGIPLQPYLTESLNNNKPWSQVATEFITASGGANENGACGLIVAQQGQPEEIVGEVSRIFLGVQIQCAQCHDHPTDRWTREQFHQLAAFFPRVASRPSQQTREISVVATDREPPFGGRRPMNMRAFGTLEHRMSDPKNPQSEGKLMEPVLFATGDKLPIGTPDAERPGRPDGHCRSVRRSAAAIYDRLRLRSEYAPRRSAKLDSASPGDDEFAPCRRRAARHREHDARPQAGGDQRRSGSGAGTISSRPGARSEPERAGYMPPVRQASQQPHRSLRGCPLGPGEQR